MNESVVSLVGGFSRWHLSNSLKAVIGGLPLLASQPQEFEATPTATSILR